MTLLLDFIILQLHLLRNAFDDDHGSISYAEYSDGSARSVAVGCRCSHFGQAVLNEIGDEKR